MPLTTGARLGPYEIHSPLGAGGMGDVYRARDTTLGRDVAIKILPDALAHDPERVARFQREAKTLASLNHPHIAQIYGLEHSGSVTALVMELVAGEDLADRIARGALSVDDALPLARQIADALEGAHGQGIIHRDLKPANIKVRPDGTIKVLDFGLAKALDSDGPSVSLANSPTITSPAPLTMGGVILGTAAYMSPEQARGRAVDERTDIWAFGCVLYEMLSGRAAFAGDNVTDIVAKVIEREPDWSALPTNTPASIHRVLRRCLQKAPTRRLADIADARLEIDEALDLNAINAATSAPVTRAMPVRALIATAIVTLVVTAIGMWAWTRASQPATTGTPITYVAASLSVGTPSLVALVDRFAAAPDGSAIVFVGPERAGLFVRRRDEIDATPLAGAPPEAFLPVVSPDGRWVAFFSDAGLMKIPLGGGTPVHLGKAAERTSLTWGADDRLRYPSASGTVIESVSANGGPTDSIAMPADAPLQRAEWLPNGRLLVSTMVGNDDRIAVREPDGTLRTIVTGRAGRIAPTGQLLYSRAEGAIWSIVAVSFDAQSARITGEPTVLARDVPVHYYSTPATMTSAGDLVYLRGAARSDRRIVSVDRAGAERDLMLAPAPWVGLAISPNGQQVALNRWDGARRTMWTLALDSRALTQVTYDGDTFYPVWAPNGRRLLFTHFTPRRPRTSMWSIAVSGQGEMEPIFEHPDAYPGGVSADGLVVYYRAFDERGEDIFSVTLQDSGQIRTPLLTTRAEEGGPMPSPGGRWLAYNTDASGRDETRVADLSDLATSVQVSANGGAPVRWNPDGSRLFYRDGDAIWEVEVGRTGPVLSSRRRAFHLPSDVRGRFDVMPDGETAILIRGGLMYSDLVVVQDALNAAARE